MGLEAASFIPELVDTNPLGNDPKSQGDDHLRLIKTAVQGSFPAFVGTTAVPASVALTEAEISDAALQSRINEFTALQRLQNNVDLVGRNVADDADHPLIKLGPSDSVEVGSTNAQQVNRCATQNQYLVDGVTVAFFVALNSGGIQVKDRLGVSKKTGFRNPTRHVTNASTDVQQDWEGAVVALNTGSTRLDFIQLEDLTAFDIINASGAGFADEGPGMTLSFFDGNSRQDGDFVMSSGSVWHFYQITSAIWYAWEIT